MGNHARTDSLFGVAYTAHMGWRVALWLCLRVTAGDGRVCAVGARRSLGARVRLESGAKRRGGEGD